MEQPPKKETPKPTLKIVAGHTFSAEEHKKFNHPPCLRANSSNQLLRWMLMTDAGLSEKETEMVNSENTDLFRGVIYLPGRIAYIKTERLLRALVMMLKTEIVLKSANGN